MGVLVLGTSGLIGSAVSAELAANGHDVVGIDMATMKEEFRTPKGKLPIKNAKVNNLQNVSVTKDALILAVDFKLVVK